MPRSMPLPPIAGPVDRVGSPDFLITRPSPVPNPKLAWIGPIMLSSLDSRRTAGFVHPKPLCRGEARHYLEGSMSASSAFRWTVPAVPAGALMVSAREDRPPVPVQSAVRGRHQNRVDASFRRPDPVPLMPDRAFIVDGQPSAVEYPTDLAIDQKLGLVMPEWRTDPAGVMGS